MHKHESVLLQEAVEGLRVREGGVYVDCTLGGGGHSEQILARLGAGRLIAFDQDDFALEFAKERLNNDPRVAFVKANFRDLEEELKVLGVTQVDGILYDLGVSSFQFDIPERGFSYQHDSPLDMRMNPTASLTAAHVVNTYSASDLLTILYRYGEEQNARQIVGAIMKERAVKPIETTMDLVRVIKSALPERILRQKGHPAKQTFQALRIAVNDELKAFEVSLDQAVRLVRPGGRLVVITFHSLEDRIAKTVFKSFSTIEIPKGLAIIPTETPLLKLVNAHVILPSEAELSANNRAHSAKLRIAEKLRA
jgi:16S rRNA (cytosine1402-N4)-methyltransferase